MLDESVNTSKLANERAGAVAPVAKIPEAYNKPASKYKRQIYTNAVNFRVSFLSKWSLKSIGMTLFFMH